MDHPKVKTLASQASSINRYKNLRLKLLQCNANIYFNRQCLTHKVTPTYTKIRVPYTSPASNITQQKIATMRIKDEIRFLYQKKEQLNTNLYKAHLQASNDWGPIWPTIQTSIHESLTPTIDKKYQTLRQKLKHLTNRAKEDTNPDHAFFPRVLNKTNIHFTNDEELLLQKGLKFNIHSKPKNWISTLAIEAETAITLLTPPATRPNEIPSSQKHRTALQTTRQ